MSGFPEPFTIFAEEIVPSFSMRIRTVVTNDFDWSKIEVGCSHWLKNRSWMTS